MTKQTNTRTTSEHSAVDGDRELSADEVEALVREYDSESNFRNLVGPTAMLVTLDLSGVPAQTRGRNTQNLG